MEVPGSHTSTETLLPAETSSWRYFLIRDGLTFISLTVVVLVLGAVTTFLFRSFQEHRSTLADQWTKRGSQELQHGQPKQAVASLRTALSFRPDDEDLQRQLAQALAEGGHIAEAQNYYVTLWEAAPGDGPTNLQLARLARQSGDTPAAVNYYRAAVFGTWQGDALEHRRDARLELSAYQIQKGELQAARAELLIAASNNTDAPTQLLIGTMLEQAHDPADAIAAYRRAMQADADRPVAQAKAGELCFAMGNYGCAESMLSPALHAKRWTPEQAGRMTTLRDHASRLQQLSFLNPSLPSSVRFIRLMNAAVQAQATLKACSTQNLSQDGSVFKQLEQRWKALESRKNLRELSRNDQLQQQAASLVNDTEQAVQSCSAAGEDDKLLAYLRSHPVTQFGAGAE